MPNYNNHVFIVGLPRTGTSIIYRTVQKLPNFQPRKLNLWETGIFKDNVSFSTDDLHYPGLLGYFFNDKNAYESFLKSIKKYTDKLRKKSEFLPVKYGLKIKCQGILVNKLLLYMQLKLNKLIWKYSWKNKIIQEYFNRGKMIRQANRIVEKTPHHYLHVHQIVWTFPDARIIWIIRHPIAVITSAVKRAKNDKNYKNYWDINNFTREFLRSFFLLDLYTKLFRKNILLVKYEDFVNEPGEEFKKICTFLDEPFDRNALSIEEHETFKWKPDPHLSSKIVKKTEKNWEDHLSLEDAKKIEIALQDLIEKYDFSFYSIKKTRNLKRKD